MTNTLKCNNCNIVIDELLAYIQNKISIADEISLVRICESAFSSEQILKSNNLLRESLPSDLCKTARKGKGKEGRLLNDIIGLFKVTDPDVMPIFVARDLEKLPPITFDHLDVSKLLKDMMLLQAEIQNIKSSYVTVEQLEEVKKECQFGKSLSPPFSAVKVNMKRGAYRDSGPIGLSQLDDTIVVTNLEHSNCQQSSPSEYNLQYRNMNINNKEGSPAFSSNVFKQKINRCITSGGRGSEPDAAVRAGAGGGEQGASSHVITSEPSDQSTGPMQKQTYAGVAKVHDPNEGWMVVQRKSQRSKNRLIGNTGNFVVECEEKFRAADRKIPLFITNVHKDTVESDIINYISKKTKENVTLEKISIKRQCEHHAYKLLVSQSKLPLYLSLL